LTSMTNALRNRTPGLSATKRAPKPGSSMMP
jgi:hypothetical protein